VVELERGRNHERRGRGVHGFLVALPLFVIVGLALGWLRMRTGSVYPGMVAHGVFNGVITIVAVSTGS
jgi:membrane protease YdiL (CAAX protease family)